MSRQAQLAERGFWPVLAVDRERSSFLVFGEQLSGVSLTLISHGN